VQIKSINPKTTKQSNIISWFPESVLPILLEENQKILPQIAPQFLQAIIH